MSPRRVSGNTALYPTDVVGLVVVAAPLAIGAVHLSTQLALGGALLVALWWLGLTTRGRLTGRSGLTSLLGLLLVWPLLQLVPLPEQLLTSLSPFAAQRYAEVTTLFSVSSEGSIAVDRPAASSVLLLIALYALVAFIVRLATSRSWGEVATSRLLWLIEGAGVSVALVALVHTALRATRLYGLYQPDASMMALDLHGPMVNPNHTAAFLLLTTQIGLARWLQGDVAQRDRWLHAGVVSICFTVLVMSGSRANLALCIIASLYQGLYAHRIGRQDRGGFLSLAGLATIVAGAMTAIWGRERLLGSLFEVSDAQGDAFFGRWEVAYAVVSEHLWSGVGLGGFQAVAAEHTSQWRFGYPDHAHNLVLHLVAECGLFVGLGLCATLVVWLVWALWRTRERAIQHGIVVALCAVVLQNQVDFSLHIPAVGLTWFALAALVHGSIAAEERGSISVVGAQWQRLVMLGVISLTFMLVGLLAHAHDPSANREKMLSLTDRDGWRSDLRNIATLHPADHDMLAVAAGAASLAGDGELALGLAKLAHARAPLAPSVLETTAAIELKHQVPDLAMDKLVTRSQMAPDGPRRAMDILLEGQSMHPGLIERFATRGIREALLVSDELERRGAISASIEVLEWANQAYPDNETIETRFVESCLLVKTCAPKLDDFSVKLLARSTEEGDPDRRIRARRLGYMVQAQLLNRDGQDRQARVLYEEVANLLPAEGFLPLSRAAWILIRTGQLQTAKARIQRLEDMAITDKDQVELLRIKSAVTKAEGDLQGAVNALQQAIRIQRNTPDLYLELAALFDMRGERRAAKSARELAERLRTR